MHPLPLERFGFVGSSHRLVGFERLGQLVLPPSEIDARRELRDALGARELLYLATCNRVECYLVLDEPASPGQLRERLRTFYAARGLTLSDPEILALAGREALRHALRVTSSLDSLIVGETEVSGQMRRAFQAAMDQDLAGEGLRRAHDEAQACARRVRAHTDLGALATSVGSVAAEKVLQQFSHAGPRASALIGVGPMTIKAAQALARFPGELLFVNRTVKRAEILAARFKGRAMSLECFRRQVPSNLDLLWTATAAPHIILSPRDLQPALVQRPAQRPLIVCDLGVPRDVDPSLDQAAGVRVVSMVELQRTARRDREALDEALRDARALVDETLARLEREGRFAALAATSARALLRERLAHIEANDQAVLVRFAEQLAGRLARQPQHTARVTHEELEPKAVTSL